MLSDIQFTDYINSNLPLVTDDIMVANGDFVLNVDSVDYYSTKFILQFAPGDLVQYPTVGVFIRAVY